MMLVSLRPSHARALSSAAAVVCAQPRAFPLLNPTDSAFMPPPPPPPPRVPFPPRANPPAASASAHVTPPPSRATPPLGAAPPRAPTSETAAKLRARLAFIARRAAARSSDAAALLVGTFARAHLPAMDVAQLRELDALLAEPENDVYAWALARADPPPRWRDSPLIAKLRAYARNEEKQRETGLKEHNN